MHNIGICGAGLIGASWAVGFANHGYNVLVYDTNQEILSNFFKVVDQLAYDLEVFKKVDLKELKSNIKICDNLEEICKNSLLIQESIVEDLEEKKNIFYELEKYASVDTILASSSSYLLPSKISKNLENRQRCIVAHPALPPHVVPFVEICPSSETSFEVIEMAKGIYKNAHYVPIVLKKEIEGFVLNRLQGALLNEAVRLHEGGYASIDDIDISLKHALGIRWAFLGPFEIMDLNAPGGIRDSFTRYRKGIKKLARQQNSVPQYTDEYIKRLESEQRIRLKLKDREERTKKRNKLIALVRKLKLEQGE